MKTFNANEVLTAADLNASLKEALNFVNITYADLKSKRDSGALVPGQQYRITDYQCSTSQRNTSSAGNQFDIIVTADTANVLNERARAFLHDGDTYFANCKIGLWELKYCIDNDTDRFGWASSSGKGVIYYMKDEFNNECPYDFKNILYSTTVVSSSGSNISMNVYTFSILLSASSSSINLFDGSLLETNFVKNNVIKPNCNFGLDSFSAHGSIITSVINVGYGSTGLQVLGGSTGFAIRIYDCMYLPYDIFYGVNVLNNFIDADCFIIVMGSNRAGMLGIGVMDNKIGNNNINIILGGECLNNTIGAYNFNISFGADSVKLENNIIGDANGNISFGSSYTTMKDSIIGNKNFKIYFYSLYINNLVIGNNNGYNSLWSSTSIEFSGDIKNVKIGDYNHRGDAANKSWLLAEPFYLKNNNGAYRFYIQNATNLEIGNYNDIIYIDSCTSIKIGDYNSDLYLINWCRSSIGNYNYTIGDTYFSSYILVSDVEIGNHNEVVMLYNITYMKLGNNNKNICASNCTHAFIEDLNTYIYLLGIASYQAIRDITIGSICTFIYMTNGDNVTIGNNVGRINMYGNDWNNDKYFPVPESITIGSTTYSYSSFSNNKYAFSGGYYLSSKVLNSVVCPYVYTSSSYTPGETTTGRTDITKITWKSTPTLKNIIIKSNNANINFYKDNSSYSTLGNIIFESFASNPACTSESGFTQIKTSEYGSSTYNLNSLVIFKPANAREKTL